jgi:hypothetical protein
MSLLGWLTGGSRKPRGRSSVPDSSGLSRMEATRPLKTGAETTHDGAAGRTALPVEPGPRRSERLEQRERLYSVVRESMVRSGVLSSGYKFKVLALDARGGQFLVMMDLAQEFGRESQRLSEIEALIAQGAKQRFGIVVTAVYWRLNEHVAVGQPQARPAATHSRPAPLAPLVPAAASVAPVAATAHDARVPTAAPADVPPRRVAAADPLQADEIAAFKQALASAVSDARDQTRARLEAKAELQLRADKLRRQSEARKASPFAWARRPAAQLTGYEDTEAFDPRPQEERNPGLSETQYGDLH